MATKDLTPDGAQPSNLAGAFLDPRAILVRWDDVRCAAYWDESEAGYEQEDNGPTHLIIGRFASDERLMRLSAKYPQYTVAELMHFRDAQD